MSPELEQVTFRRSAGGAAAGAQLWELVAPTGEVFAWAEVFEAPEQWGVRLRDRAPSIVDHDLVRLVGKLLTWEVHCPADTVDVVLGRSHDHHTLVRVGGEYV
jgi:hypothetical protein